MYCDFNVVYSSRSDRSLQAADLRPQLCHGPSQQGGSGDPGHLHHEPPHQETPAMPTPARSSSLRTRSTGSTVSLTGSHGACMFNGFLPYFNFILFYIWCILGFTVCKNYRIFDTKCISIINALGTVFFFSFFKKLNCLIT